MRKVSLRQRLEGLSAEQAVLQLADECDTLDGTLDEHIEEDEQAFLTMSDAWQEWKLTSLRFQNKQLIALAFVLLTAIVSIVVALVTAR